MLIISRAFSAHSSSDVQKFLEIFFPEFTVASFSTYKLKLISRVLSLSSLFNFQGPLCSLSRVLSDYITSFLFCQALFLIFFRVFSNSFSEPFDPAPAALLSSSHSTFSLTLSSSACIYYHNFLCLSTVFLNFFCLFFSNFNFSKKTTIYCVYSRFL